MENKKIAVIGAGNMGGAIIAGLVKSGSVAGADLFVSDPRESILNDIKSLGANTSDSNLDSVRNADAVILAVKPRLIPRVLQEIKSGLNESKILISIAAGVTLEDLERICDKNVPLFRVMPNTAISLQQSLTCISSSAGDKDRQFVSDLFSKLGKVIEIPEDLMAAATVLSSCGIAFALRYIRASMQGGIEIGFSSEMAQLITAQTLKGAAELILQKGLHPENEIDKVTTPGGITIAGLNEMEYNGFSSSLIQGIMKSYTKIGDSLK